MTNPMAPKPKRSITTAAAIIGFVAGVITVIILVRLYHVFT